MKLRLEIAAPKSTAWAWTLRLLKQCPGYAPIIEDGLEIHAVDFGNDDKDRFCALWEHVRAWKNVALFIDGRLAPRSEGNRIAYGFFVDKQRERFVSAEIERAQREAREKTRRPPLPPAPDEPI